MDEDKQLRRILERREEGGEDRITPGRRLMMRAALTWVLMIATGAVGPWATESDGSSSSLATSSASAAPGACGQPRPIDEVWLVSTRGLCCPAFSEEAGPALRVERYEAGEGWRLAGLDEFFAESPALPTVIYAHGNRIECCEAAQAGWDFYFALMRGASESPAIRYVIWSWPSDQIPGVFRDVRTKARRTDWDGVYLGWFVSRLDPRTPVSLAGYSYGARIITGGLHLLGGGRLSGRQLPSEPAARPRYRVALLAAALDSWWLSPGAPHGKAPQRIDHLLLLNNSQDSVLHRYPIVDWRCRAEALGFAGLSDASGFGPGGRRVEQWDAAAIVGRSHHASHYLASTVLMERVRRCLLWRPLDL